MDLRAAIRAYMARESVSQSEVAKRAAVSQSTVSRALKRQPIYSGRARAKLFIFMHKQPKATTAPVQTALGLVWDGTDAHAEALADLITASGRLWPGLREEDGDDGERRAPAQVTP
jgi:hypothetical protein